ncbi:MAG TPA: matrixin family metalloprotease [Polyangiaceae bacterium]
MMPRFFRFLSSLGLAAAAFVASQPAQAYCRTKACDTDPSYGDAWDGAEPTECVRNAQGCFIQGTPLWRSSDCISFGVQRDGSASSGIDFDTARAIVQVGFDTWAAADCGGGETPSFISEDRGEIACERIEYNQRAPNANVFLFRDNDWPYDNLGGHALALTTITYSVETGEIYDADVEFNSHQSTFTTTDEPLEIISDFQSVATHEIGHVLGLSHSERSTAVMRGTGYSEGSIDLRTLTDDDITGICDVFPPGPARGSCKPRHGFSAECEDDAPLAGNGGCRFDPRGTPSSSSALLALAVLGLVLRRRRAPRP